MVAVAIITIGILGFFGAFRYITKSLYVSRTRTLATNLGQEKVEALKNLSYYELLITTASAVDNSVSPGITYDTSNYPPEIISIGGVRFTRYTYVSLAQIDSNVISTVTFTYPDTGMKQITVNLLWRDGGTTKKWTLSNLLENPNVNPLDVGISGNVKIAGSNANLAGAKVTVEQNPDWNSTTDASGNYTFRVYHGSYTIRASSAGFYDGVTSVIDASAGSGITAPQITLTEIATGTVVGNVWLNKDILVSQVVVSSPQANQNNFDLQVIELYNPTTAAINIGANSGTPQLKVNYRTASGCSNYTDCSDSTYGLKLTYISTYVAPNRYFVIANTNTFTLAGTAVTADAVYDDSANTWCGSAPPGANWNLSASPPRKAAMVVSHGGSVWLSRGSNVADAIGWQHNGNLPAYYEGTYLNITGVTTNGFPASEQIVRVTSPTGNFSLSNQTTYGRAYDSGNNVNDWAYDPVITTIQVPPRSSSVGAFTPIAGVPAVGAVVASSDPYSGSATASAAYISSGSLSLLYAHYTLPGVTTGTWQITIASGSYYNQYTPVNVTQSITTSAPNGGTTPSWPAANVYSAMLTSGSLSGFVKGQVSDANGNPISGITVIAGGTTKTTTANGGYFAATATGPVVIIVNPNNANTQYVQSMANVTLTEGAVLTQDFTLTKGGNIQGYLTTGTTPLPNYLVAASIGGSQYGSAASNSSGYFTIRNLSTGTYTVAPALEIGQDSSPNDATATVTSAGTVFVGTFTVSGAFGSIDGTVSMNSALVTTGALLIASTGTIPSSPTTIVASSAPALSPIYAGSSKADGTYTLPVRGGNTYYLAVYVPTINSAGTSVSITTKTYSNIYVSPAVSTSKTVTIP